MATPKAPTVWPAGVGLVYVLEHYEIFLVPQGSGGTFGSRKEWRGRQDSKPPGNGELGIHK